MSLPTAEEIALARVQLAARDPGLAVAHAAAPDFPWRNHPRGFAGLLQMVVGQQVSTHAARAIWARVSTGLGEVTPEAVMAADEAALRGFGLSGQKVRYARAMAEAHLSGAADFDRIPEMDDEAAIAALTGIKGVGRWTAELYLLFCEGRRDAFPAGDLALQEGLRLADAAALRPTEKALYGRAEAWRPHRGVAALLLWAYYSQMKRRQAVPVTEPA